MNNNKKHKLDDEDIKKFSEKIKAEVSERTLAIYVKILMDIRDDNLVYNLKRIKNIIYFISFKNSLYLLQSYKIY